MALDPQTLHGTHYQVEAFDLEVERRLQEFIDEEGDDWDESDYFSANRNFLQEVYYEWNPGIGDDDFIRFEQANSLKYNGIATMGHTQEDSNNPLLAPIHGISLKDYAAIAMNLTNFQEKDLFGAFGIDQAIWSEVNTLWPKRMQEDTSFTIVTLYGQYFMEVGNHPLILQLKQASGSTTDENEHLQRLREDKYYYLELEAARTAAYEYGIDGAQWIADNFGISLTDFQAVAMQWMTERNQRFDSNEIMQDHEYSEEMQEKYKQQFAEEQGGNIADDIEF